MKYTEMAKQLVELSAQASEKMQKITEMGNKALKALKETKIIVIKHMRFETSLGKGPSPNYHLGRGRTCL